MPAHPLSARSFPGVSTSHPSTRGDARRTLRQNYRPGRPVPGWLARVLNWL